jgi:hypothetical protein
MWNRYTKPGPKALVYSYKETTTYPTGQKELMNSTFLENPRNVT